MPFNQTKKIKQSIEATDLCGVGEVPVINPDDLVSLIPRIVEKDLKTTSSKKHYWSSPVIVIIRKTTRPKNRRQ